MKFETRINENNQVMIPTHYVKKYNLEEGDIIQWNEDEDGKISITFIKNRI